jgi:hypothetical protein
MTQPPWSMLWTTWLTMGVIVVAIFAAAWTALNHPRPRPELPIHHAAAAALIGYVAWEGLTLLPGMFDFYLTATAGIDDLGSVLLGQRAYLIVASAVVVGSAIAIAGILRRRPWGPVLGIGLAAAHVIGSAATVINAALLESGAEVAGGEGYFALVAPTLLLGAVPPIVAIGLLVWPMIRRPSDADVPPTDRVASPGWDPRSANQPR